MIRRLLIFFGGATIVLAGVCLLSRTWQFGHVGSWGSIGLRDGKLWYIWRVTPISDGEGFYVDDVSAVNRAMYHISMGASWREVRAWPWLLGILAAIAYALILPPILRLRKRPAPKWLIGTLLATCIFFAALWIMSHLALFTFDATQVHLRLSNGSVMIILDRHRTLTTLPWGAGWNVQRGIPGFRFGFVDYLSFRGGNVMLSLPLTVLIVMFVVPTLVLARPDRRALPGHCRRCAYDLTGNVSGVCPECGTKCQNVETSISPNVEMAQIALGVSTLSSGEQARADDARVVAEFGGDQIEGCSRADSGIPKCSQTLNGLLADARQRLHDPAAQTNDHPP